MRHARRDVRFIEHDGEIAGIGMGWDYVSEHEWGIRHTADWFGLDNTKDGLERFKIRRVPETLRWLDGVKDSSGFFFSLHEDDKPDQVFFSGEDTLYTGWSEHDFAAFGKLPAEQKWLRTIFDAFRAGDGAMWVGGATSPFANTGGLFLVIASKVPEEAQEAMKKGHQERRQLEKDAKATGIKDKLDAAGKQYFSLSPKRASDGGVMFWLNPTSQSVYQAGWYTVAELEQWIENKGPVVKKKGKRA